MELKHGYKHTEVGVIPEDWSQKSIYEISTLKTGPFGTTLKASEYAPSGGVPIISVGEIREGYLLVTGRTPRVSENVTRRLPEYLLKEGDIVCGRKGSVERSALIRHQQDGWFLGSDGIRIRPTKGYYGEYVAFHLQTLRVKSWLLQNSIGTTMPSLNQEVLNRVVIPFPPTLAEQCAIAAALSDVEALITSLEGLIAKKRAVKQGAMQELLTGKTCLPGFSGEWMAKMLGNVLDFEQPVKYIVEDTNYSDQNDTPVLTAGKTFILGYTNEQDGIFENLPVIIFDDFTTESRYVDFPFKVKSSAIKLLKAKNNCIDLRYIFERMQLIRFAIGDHKRYYISEYQYIYLDIPPIEEQIAIIAISSDMDAEITALEQKRDKTRLLKQGMMQELLTGKTRLV